MYDVIFAGGGLASCLAAYRLKLRRPALKLLVVEGAATLGGNHTWSFFPTDLTADQLEWVEPLIVHRWDEYGVRFPGFERTLTTGYCTTNSEYFHKFMLGALGDCVLLRSPIVDVRQDAIVVEDGQILAGRCVIDGRGPQPSANLVLGFQKFTGQVLELGAPHGLRGPVIMDATVAQEGDYRFFYTLPLGPRELLVEDTRYSDTPTQDTGRDTAAIDEYAAASGWSVTAVVREEQGALPITLGGDIDAFLAEAPDVPRIGLRAALFHATTGYSFADAVRTADALADALGPHEHRDTATVRALLADRTRAHWSGQHFWRLLNRMLFLAAEADRRWVVMRRFYRLNQGLIERFYAGRSTLADKARILTGRPPVAILPALRCLPERSAAAHATGGPH